jgi:hypothetical protein
LRAVRVLDGELANALEHLQEAIYRRFIEGTVVGTGGDGRPSHFSALKGRMSLPITRAVSIESTLARVSVIRQALADPAGLIGSSAGTAATGGTAAPSGSGESSFAQALNAASGTAETPAAVGSGENTGASALANLDSSAGTVAGYPYSLQGVEGAGSSTLGASGGSAGQRIVAIAEGQLGQPEQPPGSNESPAIAQYRTATAGAVPGAPWCAYFASWVARQAGEPIGSEGQGLGAVSEIWSWEQSTGRAITNGPGVVPKPAT